jgi:hypothetical protein
VTALSKTDKTRPYWVKVRDKHSYLIENHDHRDGVCNLPERPAPHNDVDYQWGAHWLSGDCVWITSYEWTYSGDARCPCYMCGYDAYWSVPQRKRQRIEGKRYCQDGWRNEY